MDEIKRIEQLRKELHEHNYKYYVLNQPTIGTWRLSTRRWRTRIRLPSV